MMNPPFVWIPPLPSPPKSASFGLGRPSLLFFLLLLSAPSEAAFGFVAWKPFYGSTLPIFPVPGLKVWSPSPPLRILEMHLWCTFLRKGSCGRPNAGSPKIECLPPHRGLPLTEASEPLSSAVLFKALSSDRASVKS